MMHTHAVENIVREAIREYLSLDEGQKIRLQQMWNEYFNKLYTTSPTVMLYKKMRSTLMMSGEEKKKRIAELMQELQEIKRTVEYIPKPSAYDPHWLMSKKAEYDRKDAIQAKAQEGQQKSTRISSRKDAFQKTVVQALF